jgi:hypothetical protein
MEATNEKDSFDNPNYCAPFVIFQQCSLIQIFNSVSTLCGQPLFFSSENLSKGATKKGLATGPLEKRAPDYRNFT